MSEKIRIVLTKEMRKGKEIHQPGFVLVEGIIAEGISAEDLILAIQTSKAAIAFGEDFKKIEPLKGSIYQDEVTVNGPRKEPL